MSVYWKKSNPVNNKTFISDEKHYLYKFLSTSLYHIKFNTFYLAFDWASDSVYSDGTYER